MAIKHQLTENERSLVSMALRDKADKDAKLANFPSRLEELFLHQVKQARHLADLIDNADEVDIWPHEGDDAS